MGIKKVIKKGFFSGFDVKRWVGLDQIKESGKTVHGMYDDIFNKKSNKAQEPKTFEACVQRYNLTEEMLQKKRRMLVYTSLGCLAGSFLIFAYTIYLILSGIYFSSMVSFMLALLLLAYAYREHFNAFQIKQRRLGCTFKEWVSHTFKGGK